MLIRWCRTLFKNGWWRQKIGCVRMARQLMPVRSRPSSSWSQKCKWTYFSPRLFPGFLLTKVCSRSQENIIAEQEVKLSEYQSSVEAMTKTVSHETLLVMKLLIVFRSTDFTPQVGNHSNFEMKLTSSGLSGTALSKKLTWRKDTNKSCKQRRISRNKTQSY